MGREHEIKVRALRHRVELLDELPVGAPRAVYLPSLLHRPPEVADVASREESLAMLTAMARDGKISAAIALARELTGNEGAAADRLDELLRTK